jgi:catechol 2,3-dioxygenase-like lactoylglutathione lyase family enzyme
MTKRILNTLGVALMAGIISCAASAQQAPAAGNETQASPVTGLVPDHATLSVEDLDKEADWYQRVLGFKMLRKSGTATTMINEQMAIPGYRIDLIKYPGSKRPATQDPIYLQQGWIHVVFHVDDVARALKQLEALQVEPKSVNKQDGVPIQILLRDPEGNEIEVRRNVQ